MRCRLAPRTVILAAALLGASVGAAAWAPRESHASIVERVVAIVGERPILLSELKRRAAPFARTSAPGAQTQSKLYAEMLQRMIDEELVQRTAARSQLKVTDEEVEAAVERVAKSNNVSASELLTEIERSGVSAKDYRRELRTQLLDAKVMNLRLQGRIRLTEDDLRAEYERLAAEERQSLPVLLRVIRLSTAGSSVAAQKRLAQTLSQQAQQGADFAELSRQHSTDEATRTAGGQLAAVSPRELPPEIALAVVALNPGQVSAPITSQGSVVVLKLEQRTASSLPPFNTVLPQLEQRVQVKKMENARRTWLDALRKSTHIEVRL